MAAPVSTNIYACVNSTTGAVRIVASTSLCVAGETGVSWALTGPTGPPAPPEQPVRKVLLAQLAPPDLPD